MKKKTTSPKRKKAPPKKTVKKKPATKKPLVKAKPKATVKPPSKKKPAAKKKPKVIAGPVTPSPVTPPVKDRASSAKITKALCKKAGVPETCETPICFIHEYCKTKADKKGKLKVERKEIITALLKFKIAPFTAQTHTSRFIKGKHPKGFKL
jgi:hypothetical protein